MRTFGVAAMKLFSNRTRLYGFIGAATGLAYAVFATLEKKMTLVGFGDWLHIFLAPILLGAFAGLLGMEQEKILRQARLLNEAKQRFTNLTHAAITKRNWDVSFHDTHVPTCWEVKNCDKKDCPSYGKQNIRCWLLAGTFCRGEVQGRFAQKLGNCAKCEVYQEAVEHDPISEIGENFNSLMWALREKEDMLSGANNELHVQYEKLEELQRKTKEMAETDGLTRLWNHSHFQRHLKKQLIDARRNRLPLTLFIIDLDHFKEVNDQFGHQKGDAVLSHVGKLLRQEFDGNGFAARYGGEEFVVILPGIDNTETVRIANCVKEKIKGLARDVNLPDRYVGASIGVADFPDCATESESLISAADAALLFAKRKGRNRVAYFCDLSETELKEGDIDRLHSRLEGASLQTIRALAEAVDANDQYTSVDQINLAHIASGLASRLGMEQEQADALALATRLHDIGKIGVPSSILRKKEKLSSEEISIVQQHPEMGQKILREGEQIQDLISAILYHHERWDGSGYPERLKGEEIPILARIVGIVDSYRAMLSDRPYRSALRKDQAIHELREGAGSQFDPQLVEIFIELVQEEPGALKMAG